MLDLSCFVRLHCESLIYSHWISRELTLLLLVHEPSCRSKLGTGRLIARASPLPLSPPLSPFRTYLSDSLSEKPRGSLHAQKPGAVPSLLATRLIQLSTRHRQASLNVGSSARRMAQSGRHIPSLERSTARDPARGTPRRIQHDREALGREIAGSSLHGV